MTTTPTPTPLPACTTYEALQALLSKDPSPISLLDCAFTEIDHAGAVIGTIIASIEGTNEEGSERHLALWAASCAIKNAQVLRSAEVRAKAGAK